MRRKVLCAACRLWEKADQNSRGPQDWNLFAELLIDRIVTKVPQYKVQLRIQLTTSD